MTGVAARFQRVMEVVHDLARPEIDGVLVLELCCL